MFYFDFDFNINKKYTNKQCHESLQRNTKLNINKVKPAAILSLKHKQKTDITLLKTRI